MSQMSSEIVLSLSPGAAPIEKLEEMREYAQMWRIWPSRFLERVPNHAYLFSAIRVAADAVYFDKIHTPTGIQLSNRVVVCLPCGIVGIQPIVIKIPRTSV